MALAERKVLAKGWTSTIYEGGDIDSDKVVKVIDRAVHKEPIRENIKPLFEAERQAYERLKGRELSSVPILDYYGVDQSSEYGLVLSRVENGDLYRHIYHNLNKPKDENMLLKWARQAAVGLAFCHKHEVLHCDIHAANCFLDKSLDLKVGDFGAASVIGSRPLLMYRSTHQLWVDDGKGGFKKDISVASEIFALGCVFYEMEARSDAFEDLKDEDVKSRLQRQEMPKLDDVPLLRLVIEKCWTLKYKSMEDVIDDIDAIVKARQTI